MKIRTLICVTLFSIAFIYPQSESFNGIKFNSQNVIRDLKTSLYLNNAEPIELENSFSISFDLSFWDFKKFGPILRIENEYGNEIRVIYKHSDINDSSSINIFIPNYKSHIHLKLSKDQLTRNNWFNLKLTIDKQKGLLLAWRNNILIGQIPYQIKNDKKFSFTFGIKDPKNLLDFDVPAISVKEIKISQSNTVQYYWELNPFKDNPLMDKISGSIIKTRNPVWVFSDHQKWKHIKDFVMPHPAETQYGIAYDSINSRLFVDAKEYLIIHNLISGKDSLIKYKTTSPAYWNSLVYDESKQLLYSFFTGQGAVSIYNIKTNEWQYTDSVKNFDGNYFGSAKFIYPENGDLFLLGGYGWYKVKNDLFKYNFEKKGWETVKLKKNEMTPRSWFTFGSGFNKGEYFIYGGFGNETGDQEYGFNRYNDLYLLNMNDSTIIKQKLPKERNLGFNYLYRNLFLDKKDSVIYYLAIDEHKKTKFAFLNKLDLKTGDAARVGDKFWETDKNKWIFAMLDFNKQTNELIASIFCSDKVELFSINYPAISETKTLENTTGGKTSYAIILVIVSVGFIFFVVVFVFYKTQKIKSEPIIPVVNNEFILQDYVSEHPKNTIKLFGGFHVFDKEGNDIYSPLSPKLKEIFLLILIKSLTNHQDGITSEELSSIIWPDSSYESAKSNRGVAINKIRKALSSVDGIYLEFLNKHWLLEFNNGSVCDYLDYLKFFKSGTAEPGISKEEIKFLIAILKAGEFLKSISYEWLDSIKFSINNDVVKYLKLFFNYDEIKNDDEIILKLCDVILAFDSVDVESIKLKIKTLAKMNNNHFAKTTYELFVAEYKQLYDEHFPESFYDIINS